MQNLNETQKAFIIEEFFKSEYSGGRTIATKLVETGECIVAGKTCIWVGGIGNFIKVGPAENAVDCSLYKFDLDYFLSSNYFKEYYYQYLDFLKQKKESAIKEFDDISSIVVAIGVAQILSKDC